MPVRAGTAIVNAPPPAGYVPGARSGARPGTKAYEYENATPEQRQALDNQAAAEVAAGNGETSVGWEDVGGAVNDFVDFFTGEREGDKLEEAGYQAAQDAEAAGARAVARGNQTQQTNDAGFYPATAAAGNIQTQAPTYSGDIYDEIHNSPGSTATADSLRPGSHRSQEYADDHPEVRNRAAEWTDQYDASDPGRVGNAIYDRATALDGPNPETYTEGRLPGLDVFAGNEGQVGTRIGARASTNYAAPLQDRAADALNDVNYGSTQAAVTRAAQNSGSDFAGGIGLGALNDAQVDANGGQFLGRSRADQLLAFDNSEGAVERELRERRAGTGQYADLLAEFNRETNRQATARGGYNAGSTMRLLESGGAKLARQELDARAALASSAQTLRQERSRDVTGGLGQAEGFSVARQGINATLAGNTAQLATGMDANRNRATEILGTTANQAETTLDRRQARVDELVGQGVSADLAQQQAIDELATDAEHTRTTRTSDATDANTAQDQLDLGYETERGQRGDALLEGEANRQVDRDRLDQTGAASATAAATDIGRLELDTQTAASTEDIAEHGQEMDAAQFIDRLGIDRDRLRVDAASQASDERQATLEATFNAYEKLGFDQASLRNQITAIQTQAELDTTMAAINARLAAAGVDAQTRDSMIKNIISIGGIFAAA